MAATAALLLSMIGTIATKSSAFVAVTSPIDNTNHHRSGNSHRVGRSAIVASNHKLSTSKIFSGNGDEDDLLERARKLREEASLMEDNLRAMGVAPPTPSTNVSPLSAVNKQLEESSWTLSYRFSSQPSPKDDSKENESPKTFYSGKIDLLLKDDGYSEQIIAKAGKDNPNENDIKIIKVWGWDRETSNEDDLDYLLFSMDVQFPKSDPDLSNQKERYYFQARVEQENPATGIALKEGTITVKKDVTEKTGGMWGFFNVAGILTEFRYCGDFVAKASRSRRH
eukprot:CAMPEP_0201250870 /NCGR_PEP_ID=MMETSP0852-20130820/65126_1 /ASSEMBLY_ACC=CAM_ASM_000632 /TAXON_ID=183588 /ORGANISM="Pseudo-nitzschia fraudulenta, Strain WWA7" /LENGTH=281 /DNA_ID=CAMNT_0047550349 /DNA_START=216 /DNA_END=1061 /DNA_ORIENTATION=-